MTCIFCKRNRGGLNGVCHDCQKKRRALRTHKIFLTAEETERAKPISERRLQPPPTVFSPPDTYKPRMGSGTKKLVDYVNKSGTVHYGRYVAKEKGYLK